MTVKTITKPTIKHARKVLATVDAGLCSGKGEPTPGMMCVEAAVCYAFGLPHSDQPPCVHPAVRAFKITLNDAAWSSKKARAKGLRAIAIAQLGSADTVDGKEFVKLLAEQTIRQIVPIALRAEAKLRPAHKEQLEAAAIRCEKDGDYAASYAARDAGYAARDAASYAASYAAGYAARDAGYAASDAGYAASAAGYAASAAGYAGYAGYAASAASAASDAARDGVLSLMAKIGVEALKKCGSLGCKWLNLCD